jgi:hypothetical protein
MDANMKACREVTKISQERAEARIGTGQELLETEIRTGLEEEKATILKANPEGEEKEHGGTSDVSKIEVAMETVSALQHRYRDRH